MFRKFFVLLVILAIVLPISFFGCKNRAEKMDAQTGEMTQGGMEPQSSEMVVTTEPSQTVATEAIPPTAAPELAPTPAPVMKADLSLRNKDIQTALKNAGFYTGAIDGKIGPKTKSAILEFQKARGLKADGKVGPITWAELEKYLIQQLQ